MNRDEAKIEAKKALVQYLRQRGTDIGASGKKKFICLNPAHPDHKPSMMYVEDMNAVYCHACKAQYDIFDLVAMDYGIAPDNHKEVFEKTYEVLGLKVDGSTPHTATAQEEFKPMERQKQDKTERKLDFTATIVNAHRALMENEQAVAHFSARGITRAKMEEYKLGYAPEGYNSLLADMPDYQSKSRKQGLYTFVLPYIDADGKASYFQTEIADRTQTDDYNGKYKFITGVHKPLFNERYLVKDTPSVIFLTEGYYDALSIEMAVDGAKAIAIQGAGGDTRFNDLCERYKPDTCFIIYADADKAGEGYVAKITAKLDTLAIPYRIVKPTSGKDPNEEYLKNSGAFCEWIREKIEEAPDILQAEANKEREEYLATSASGYLQAFIDGITSSVDTDCIPTGFRKLDEVLDGGLYEGLITVGAISSLGKTSLCLQMADQIAAAGNDVLIFSLEMARTELIAKSISRHTFTGAIAKGIPTNAAKTHRGITSGKRYVNYNQQELALINDAITDYATYAERVYIQEGEGDIGVAQIRETVKRHIHLTGKKPVVVIDYLQLLAPADVRATDKQNTDKAVLELKRISRDYKIPVICISSLNRENYNSAISMSAYKESGIIEFSSDVLIGLQPRGVGGKDFDVDEAKKKDPREIELKILKNRNGKTGDTINYLFYAPFNFFTENQTPVGYGKVIK